ncbi:MAG: sensor histidine kinase [Elusimicrobiales bacterium]
MKRLSGYSSRLRLVEAFSYSLLAVPWLSGFLGADALRYGPASLALKIFLSAAIIVFIWLLRDVRRKMYALELLKQNLSLAAIHDLKSPLTAMVASLQLIDDPDIDPEMRGKLLAVAAEGSRDMQKLIQVLLDTERMEISELVLQKQPLDIGQLIQAAASRFLPVSADTGIELNLPAGGLPGLYADRDLVFRVFENLVLNAFKYSRRGGKIDVSARFEGGVFYFSVADTGQGIAPEHIEKVFGKYFRVEGQDSQSRKGSGIGLYFCRLAVEAHGGKISIDSRLGAGTTVKFELPAK